MEDKPFFVHASSVIDDGAKIGTGSKIWHFCHLSATSSIGDNCIIGQNVFVDNNVTIGDRVKIQNNVSVYNGVMIEDDVFLGPSIVFTNVINPRSFIGRKDEFRKTLIRQGATIGANATLLCGIEIGRYAMIGAGAVVVKSVNHYALMVGNPARQIGWVSEAGMTLDFSENIAICSQTGQTYKLENDLVSRVV